MPLEPIFPSFNSRAKDQPKKLISFLYKNKVDFYQG